MRSMRGWWLGLLLSFGLVAGSVAGSVAMTNDILPHWNDSHSKRQIVEFVERVTDPRSADFVPVKDRIAVFDNDGTLWSEQPIYGQFAFAIDRIKALAPEHPEWLTTQPFKAVLEGDLATLMDSGQHHLMQLLVVNHGGLTSDEFRRVVRDWLATARHPTTGRAYTEMVYQPMLSLLDYLRANEFKTYIVSGGGVEFMRAWAEDIYGIPPEQIIGSTLESAFTLRDGVPMVIQQPKIAFINDRGGKPEAIERRIGQRPIMAFGNSDGDLEMLQWTSAGAGPRFGLIVHHTDNAREVAYDRASKVGQLDKALDLAPSQGWTVVDIKNDWSTVFAAD